MAVRKYPVRLSTRTPQPSHLLLHRHRADLDVAERDAAVIALQANKAQVRLGKARHPAEFARRYPGVEIIAMQHVLKIFHTIDLMHALFGGHEQADVVPLAHGFGRVEGLARGGVNRRLIERVEPAATDLVRSLFVVLQLKFRAGRPDGTAGIGHVIHDAAVARFGDVVVQLQFKPVELVAAHDIARVVRIHAHQRAILHLPAGADAVALEIMPACEIIAVEQELPAGGFFSLGQGVDLGAAQGAIMRGATGQTQNRCSQDDQQRVFHGR